MSASATDTVARQRETKVCPGSEVALDVVGVKAKCRIKKEAERDAARLLRTTFRIQPPVDPAAIANELGLQVFVTGLKEITLGGLLMKPEEDPRIFVNRRDGYLRQRLTCALELGHYLRRSAETNKYARVDRRGAHPGSEEEPGEVYAHEFAACLLMPKDDVEILVELRMDDLQMALHFLVPREAVQVRLKDLGLPAPELEAA